MCATAWRSSEAEMEWPDTLIEMKILNMAM